MFGPTKVQKSFERHCSPCSICLSLAMNTNRHILALQRLSKQARQRDNSANQSWRHAEWQPWCAKGYFMEKWNYGRLVDKIIIIYFNQNNWKRRKIMSPGVKCAGIVNAFGLISPVYLVVIDFRGGNQRQSWDFCDLPDGWVRFVSSHVFHTPD